MQVTGQVTAQPSRRQVVGERILMAARELFAESGLDGVTMDDVAEAAGVSRATVFNHFESKHGLVEAITAQVLGGYVQLLDDAIGDREASCEDQVRSLCLQMGVGIETSRRFYRSIFREIAKISLGIDEGSVAQTTRQIATNRLEQLVTRWQARRQASSDYDARDMARLFDSIIFGAITHWLYEEDDRTLVEQMAIMAELFIHTITISKR